MKSYAVLVECEDWITVDAETEAEAEQMAADIFSRDMTHDLKATVMHSTDLDDNEEQ